MLTKIVNKSAQLMPVYWNHPICPKWSQYGGFHYTDVTMSPMASKITSLTIVYSTVRSSSRSKKTSKRRVTGLCAGNSPVTGEFPAQRASNAEKVSIWWRHHPFHARSWTCLNKIYLYISWILCLILPSQGGFFKFLDFDDKTYLWVSSNVADKTYLCFIPNDWNRKCRIQ